MSAKRSTRDGQAGVAVEPRSPGSDRQVVKRYVKAVTSRPVAEAITIDEIAEFDQLTTVQLDLVFQVELARLRRTTARAKWARRGRTMLRWVLEGLAVGSLPASTSMAPTMTGPQPFYPFAWGYGYWSGTALDRSHDPAAVASDPLKRRSEDYE